MDLDEGAETLAETGDLETVALEAADKAVLDKLFGNPERRWWMTIVVSPATKCPVIRFSLEAKAGKLLVDAWLDDESDDMERVSILYTPAKPEGKHLPPKAWEVFMLDAIGRFTIRPETDVSTLPVPGTEGAFKLLSMITGPPITFNAVEICQACGHRAWMPWTRCPHLRVPDPSVN